MTRVVRLFIMLPCCIFLHACPTPGQGGGLAAVDVEGLPKRMQALCLAGLAERLVDKGCSFEGEAKRNDGGSAPPAVTPDTLPDGATAQVPALSQPTALDGGEEE